MKKLICLIVSFAFSSVAGAAVVCKSPEIKVAIDLSKRNLELTRKDGVYNLKILGAKPQQSFQMYGQYERAFDVEGGYFVVIKPEKNGKYRQLNVYKDGDPLTSFRDCKVDSINKS
jgi:hypothetical protein